MASDETTELESGDEVESEDGKKKKGGSKVLPAIIIAVGLLGAAFIFKSCGGGGGGDTTATTNPGAVTTTTFAPDAPRINVNFDPMTLNLAGGRYLRVGLTLGFVSGAEFGNKENPTIVPVAGGGGAEHGGASVDPGAALAAELKPEVSDLVISTLAGGDPVGLVTPAGREQVRSRLAVILSDEIGTDVKVYFTSFVVAG